MELDQPILAFGTPESETRPLGVPLSLWPHPAHCWESDCGQNISQALPQKTYPISLADKGIFGEKALVRLPDGMSDSMSGAIEQ